MKNREKHFWHYLLYSIIFGGGLLFVFFTKGNANLQALFIILTAFLYFLWAMVHHYIHHEFHVRVVVEYILIVVLGTILTLFLFRI